jgi:glycosyltransferase involved in cell wall biosynthesis
MKKTGLMKMINKRLIVILGMHRSGTSAITRGLQTLGVELGGSLLSGLDGNNAKGFWEDVDLNALNIDILSAIGSDWHHLAPIEQSDVTLLIKKGYFLRAVDLLRQKVSNVSIFGFKDPRVAKLLPFWKGVFKKCELDCGYVLVLRNPLSVVKSLEKRDGFDSEKSYLLWLEHVITSLSGTNGEKSILVDFDIMMQRPDLELARIATCFGLKVNPIECQLYTNDFLEESLRHTVYKPDDLLLDYTCPPLVHEVYSVLHELASEKTQVDQLEFENQIKNWINELNRLKSPLKLIDRLWTKNADVMKAATDLDMTVGRLNQMLSERDGQNLYLNQAVVDREGEISNLNRVLAERDEREEKLSQEIAEQATRVAGLSETLVTREGEISNLDRVLAERDEREEKLSQEIVEQAIRVAGLSEALANREGEISNLNRAVAERDEFEYSLIEQEEKLKQEIVEQATRVASLSEALANREGEISNLNRVLAERGEREAKLKQGIVEHAQQVSNLTQSIVERDRIISRLNQERLKYDETIGNLNLSRTEQNRQIGELKQTLAERDTQVDSIKGLLQTIDSLIIDRDAQKEEVRLLKSAYYNLSESHTRQIASITQRLSIAQLYRLDDLLKYQDRQFIECMFLKILKRQPDSEGFNYYIDRLRSGIPKIQIIAQVLDSREAKEVGVTLPGSRKAVRRYKVARFPLLGIIFKLFMKEYVVASDTLLNDLLRQEDAQFVASAYTLIMNRVPDPEGLNYYLGCLNSGIPKIRVLDQILASCEATNARCNISELSFAVRRYKLSRLPLIGWCFKLFMPNIACTEPTEKSELALMDDTLRKDVTLDKNSKLVSSHSSTITALTKCCKKILLVSYYCPTRAHAGGLRILDIYKLIKEKFPAVELDIFSYSRPDIDWSYSDIEDIFDNIYYSATEDLTVSGFLSQNHARSRPYYDVIDLQFHQAANHIDDFRALGKKILFTPMESITKACFIDMQETMQQAPTVKREDALMRAMQQTAEELMFCLKADEVVCVSESDADFLRTISRSDKIYALETGISTIEFQGVREKISLRLTPENKENIILFIAYFGSETNRVALRWYLEYVHPIIKGKIENYRLHIVGRGDMSTFKEKADESVVFIGEVPSLGFYINAAKVGIAPALGGAGLRGKITQYAIYGVPCVASPIAAKGLVYTNETDIYVAEQPDDFAKKCISLLINNDLNRTMGQRARENAFAKYSWESKFDAIKRLYTLEDCLTEKQLNGSVNYQTSLSPQHATEPNSSADKTDAVSIEDQENPKVTVLVPSFNHGRFIYQRIKSILEQTYANFELVVIDDCSEDDSDSVISTLQAQYGFHYIRNEHNSGTPFSAWERIITLTNGDYIWLCESDDYADPHFLEEMVRAMQKNSEAVIAYCDSNIVDENGRHIDHTDTYFHEIWRETRWDNGFVNQGKDELVQFQMRGQTVPNMSSALISTAAFRKAYHPYLKSLKLTGDWLFVGWLMRHGKVVYCKQSLNHFRRHAVTARVRVKSAQSQAEFVLTKYLLFRAARQPLRKFATLMSTDLIRFLHEPASLVDVLRALIHISISKTLKCGAMLAVSLAMNGHVATEFYQRYRLINEDKCNLIGQ